MHPSTFTAQRRPSHEMAAARPDQDRYLLDQWAGPPGPAHTFAPISAPALARWGNVLT